MADLDVRLANRIREVREELGLSQTDLAQRMNDRGHPGFQQQTVARIESGNRKVTYGEAVDIAVSMNHTPEGLIGQPGEGALVSKGARVGEAARALSNAADDYTSALFGFVVTADQIDGQIRENQQRYLEVLLSKQTPAMMTLDASTVLRAAISRSEIDEEGPYLKRLTNAIERDRDALVSAQGPSIEEIYRRNG